MSNQKGSIRAKDTAWPPIGVRDLKPDWHAKKETVRFNTLELALASAKKNRTNPP